jgi:hypothetical protein
LDFHTDTPKGFCIVLGILLCGIFLFPSDVLSEFYKYVDKDGKIYYVDDLGKVPPEYQNQIHVYKEKYDYLPEDQRTTARDEDRATEVELELERRQKLEQELDRAREQEEAEKLRQSQEELDKKLVTKVVIEGNRVLVPVTLSNDGNEVETLLLLDTGASQMVIHRNIADQLNIVTIKKGMSQVAGGQTIQTEMGQLGYLKVGPIKMLDPYVIIINHDGPAVNYNGLLGMNFLRNVQYNIDFQNKVIKWTPPQRQGQQN